MLFFKKSHLMLMLGLIAPLCSNAGDVEPAEDYCIAVSGGFGQGGTSFIAKGFTQPEWGSCVQWSGITKTASSVIAISTGTACLSSDGGVLEVSVSSTNPNYIGQGVVGSDHIRLCPDSSNCPIGSGRATGSFSTGSAEPQICTSELLALPAFHD